MAVLAQIVGPGYTYFSGGLHTFVYDSSLQSGEINLRRQMQGWRMVIGFRYMELTELFTATSNGSLAYTLDAHNYLYGFQAGGDATRWESASHPLRIDANIKAGVFGNQTNAHVVASNFLTGTANDRDWSTAFVSEGAIAAVLQLTDRIALRGGYQFIWVDNIGLATSMLGAPDTNTVTAIMNADDDIVYHGGFAGLIATY